MLPMNYIALLVSFLAIYSYYRHQQQLLLLLCYWQFNVIHQNVILQRINRRRQRLFRPYWVLPRPLQSWFEIHYRQRIIPENFFYRQMRMKRVSFDLLLATITPYIRRQNTRFRNCIPPEKILAVALYRLAHGGGYENAGVAMNVGRSTALEAFEDVVNSLYALRNEYIKFPSTIAETQDSIETFELLSELPNIAGAIDGTHIKIKAPQESKADYWSRYSQYDVVFHDSRVLRNTGIYEKAERGDVHLSTGLLLLYLLFSSSTSFAQYFRESLLSSRS
ncbi:protein ALP1-like [Nematostella vectensis]|uniref:protein ALP1-like n=1 Tax=Nematostella vectensis TaxID=45351 RepID=UPI00207704CB|nr:protein ALP1-like [Nematostella vectensis]